MELRAMVELNDAELDAVAAGALIRVDDQNVLNRNEVDVDIPVTVRDINVAAAAAVAVLGAAGAAAGIAD